MSLDLGQVLLLAYLIVLGAGGWVLEFLARAHFFAAAPEAGRSAFPRPQLVTVTLKAWLALV